MFGFGKNRRTHRPKEADMENDQRAEQENDGRSDVPASIIECEKLVKDFFGNSFDIVVQAFNTQKKWP